MKIVIAAVHIVVAFIVFGVCFLVFPHVMDGFQGAEDSNVPGLLFLYQISPLIIFTTLVWLMVYHGTLGVLQLVHLNRGTAQNTVEEETK